MLKQFTRARLYLKTRQFTPTIAAIIIVLFTLTGLINLGLWQLRRADYKRKLLHAYGLQKQASPFTLSQLQQKLNTKANLKSLLYARVQLTGHFDSAHTIFLDNKFYRHRAGYEVLTPFIPVIPVIPAKNSAKSIALAFLVNRGWVPRGVTRQLPTIPAAPTSNVTLEGILDMPPRKPFTLGADKQPAKPSWPLRIQSIKISHLQRLTGYGFYPFVVRSAPGQAGSFKYNWQPVLVHPEKHIGYAIQWFAFAAVLLIIFIVVNVKPRPKP